MGVVLLLALIWVAVLVPPALRARAARQEAFLISLGNEPLPAPRPRPRHSVAVQRRRRIAGGLLVAAVVTLVIGLLPTFRVLLIVHLFLVDSFLAYIALLAHVANRAARAAATTALPEQAVTEPARPARRWRRQPVVPGGALLGELTPIVPLG